MSSEGIYLYFFLSRFIRNLPGSSFRKIPWVTPQNCKIWKKSGKSFRDIPWVTARFLEIVSGICLYGLSKIPLKSLVVNCWTTFFSGNHWKTLEIGRPMKLILVEKNNRLTTWMFVASSRFINIHIFTPWTVPVGYPWPAFPSRATSESLS